MPGSSSSGGIFDIDAKKILITELSAQMSVAGFWENSEQSTRVVKELKSLKSSVELWEAARNKYQELYELSGITTPDEIE